ncbi:MAG: hypothetical protein NZ578_14400 [Candidatus Binatia bacterium]|nr:hypothetical protein [Candidatus Binatia bacterium]
MTTPMRKGTAERLSRLFRKAGVLLGKGRWREAIAVLRAGEALARALGDEDKAALFREEITKCEDFLRRS